MNNNVGKWCFEEATFIHDFFKDCILYMWSNLLIVGCDLLIDCHYAFNQSKTD